MIQKVKEINIRITKKEDCGCDYEAKIQCLKLQMFIEIKLEVLLVMELR